MVTNKTDAVRFQTISAICKSPASLMTSTIKLKRCNELLLYPHHKMWGVGAIMDSLCRVRPSPLSCPLYKSYTNFSSNLAKMFTSTRGCAEPMLPMCQLKVKVTFEGHISNNQILDMMSCPLCKSYTNWKIFFNLGSNVHLNKGMCITHVTLLPA